MTRWRLLQLLVVVIVILAYVVALTRGTFELPFAATAEAVAAQPTVVSLTFDDNVADQVPAARMLARNGLPATFFVISGRIGHAGYMTLEDIRAMRGLGHEIGGHTVNHLPLPGLDPLILKRQVCTDRVTLLRLGFAMRSFAYPTGGHDAAAEAAVAACGYNSGRLSGGLARPDGCFGCPTFVAIPPAPKDLFQIRTPTSMQESTTLDVMKGDVERVVAAGGSWVPLVFHHVCDHRCNPLAITPRLLAEFVAWLREQIAGGRIVVRTVGDVIGGPVRPSVPGPTLTPTSSRALLQNASLALDLDRNNIADCFQHGGVGKTTARWRRVRTSRGVVAEQVTITKLAKRGPADRKLVSAQDFGACAPLVKPGKRYRATVRYVSSAPVHLVAYYRNRASGRWAYWRQSDALSASARRRVRSALWVTPKAPRRADALSIGISLRDRGTMFVERLQLGRVR